jgi:hypothetical protein
LLEIARTGNAKPGQRDVYGRRYTIDFIMVTAAGRATVRSGWIVIRGKKAPRLTTCYVRNWKR